MARLPETSLYGGDKVYVIKDGRLEGRKVRVVGVSDQHILVAGAIKDGERVIRTRLSTPGDGLLVKERP